jgi:cytochrome oxidase Cu insertion factor (SCO1/SenC/PrrC family)
MSRTLAAAVLALAMLLSVSAVNAAPPEEKATPPVKIKVGDVAPDFTLLDYDGKELKKISLQDFRGKKNVVLAFYVFAFTGG